MQSLSQVRQKRASERNAQAGRVVLKAIGLDWQNNNLARA